MKPEPIEGVAVRPTGWRLWWSAMRPRTLTIAATPVLVGCALARAEGAALDWLVVLVTLTCALAIQAGTNLHNDVADFERGNDRAERLGPLRVTAAGWAAPAQVHRAAGVAFACALLLGLALVARGGWPILALGLASLAAGWAYSGGPRPISYTPLGELFVLAFFGLAAVAGSHYLQSGRLTPAAALLGLAIGAMGAAVLMINNIRDLAEDTRAGRRTLAAVLGAKPARAAYAALMLLPFAVAVWLALATPPRPALLGVLVLLPATIGLVWRIHHTEGAALNALLAQTARIQFLFGLLLAMGLSL